MSAYRYRLGQLVLINQIQPGRSSADDADIVRPMLASMDAELRRRAGGLDTVERAVSGQRPSVVIQD